MTQLNISRSSCATNFDAVLFNLFVRDLSHRLAFVTLIVTEHRWHDHINVVEIQ